MSAPNTTQPVAQPTTAEVNGIGNGPQIQRTTPILDVICGPLLNFKRMSNEQSQDPQWHGSVLIVLPPGSNPEPLTLTCLGPCGEAASTTHNNGYSVPSQGSSFPAVKLYEDSKKGFWRYNIDLLFQEYESGWEYSIPHLETDTNKALRFVVPSKHESMRIMFHSCNGFSVGTDEESWQGPALWNDVLRVHKEAPFHVMIGGGDQIYNDNVRVDGPLRPWTDIGNPKKRRAFPFGNEMRAECDEFYFQNYVKWYGCQPFASANGQIAQLNIWDDHDIIDGFGSYTDHFMKCAVFRGIGGVAHKYYLLFQHHIAPPPSTFTTDAPQTTRVTGETTAVDETQVKDTWVLSREDEDPSFIIGQKPGPYVEERSRSLYCQLGKRIAFLGIDARTERTRHQVNYPETYDLIFKRTSEELARSNGTIKHLLLLLGVPIAYPRLQWLENIFQSPLIGPVKFLNKRFGFAGSLFNKFDGKVDLLDDLDDHYTARQHKHERRELIQRLQNLAKQYNVRVTILGGDVHLAAVGRFYSKPNLHIPAEHDWRYMANIISSAITNKPPPAAVANLLARRNKIHHLDHETDETLLELFDKNPGEALEGVKPKTAASNNVTMPSRNYAIIAESHTHSGTNTAVNGVTANGINGVSTNGVNGTTNGANGTTNGTDPESFEAPKNPREPLHAGEEHAGTTHSAAQGLKRTGLAGVDGLDVTIRVEIHNNPSSKDGETEGYGISIPALDARGAVVNGHEKR
jgi:hypothetical protein